LRQYGALVRDRSNSSPKSLRTTSNGNSLTSKLRPSVYFPPYRTHVRGKPTTTYVLPHVVEKLLNHRLGAINTDSVLTDVAEVYNLAKYMSEMRAAVVLWENKLGTLGKLANAA
jgi:hypothetical protein